MDINFNNLKMTDEEQEQLAWCYANLEDIQVAEVQEEALEIAMREINAPEAAEKLLELLVTVMIRNAEEQRCGGGGRK